MGLLDAQMFEIPDVRGNASLLRPPLPNCYYRSLGGSYPSQSIFTLVLSISSVIGPDREIIARLNQIGASLKQESLVPRRVYLLSKMSTVG